MIAARRTRSFSAASNPHGFTLVEMIVSLIGAAMIAGGIVSAILLVTRALPAADARHEDRARIAAALDRLQEEIQSAIVVTQSSTNMIEFTLPDRSGDDLPELVRYAWGGTAGNPLQRTYNAGTPVNVLENTQAFSISTTAVSAVQTTSDMKLSPEVLLATFMAWPNAAMGPGSLDCSSTSWAAFEFWMTPPVSAVRAKVTRVLLPMQRITSSATGTVSVSVHALVGAVNPVPSSSSLGTPSLRFTRGVQPIYGWEEFTFLDTVLASPWSRYAVVVKVTGGDVVRVPFRGSGSAPTGHCAGLYTTDGGANWAPDSTSRHRLGIPMLVYGTFETSGSQAGAMRRRFIESVSMRAVVAETTQSDCDIHLLNRPELIGQ